MRAPWVPLLAAPLLLGAAAGPIAGGPTEAAIAQGAKLAGVALVMTLAGWGAGWLTTRDARRAWTPSPAAAGFALTLLGVVVLVALLDAWPVLPFALRGGYLAGRGEPRGADVFLAGVVAPLALGVGLHAAEWDDSPAWVIPAALAAAALATREAWDLALLRAAAGAPGSASAARAAWLATLGWLAVGLAGVLLFGLLRDELRGRLSAVDTSAAKWAALAIAAASLGALGWLVSRRADASAR